MQNDYRICNYRMFDNDEEEVDQTLNYQRGKPTINNKTNLILIYSSR